MRHHSFRFPVIAFIPILVLCVFGALAVYSFLLLQHDEAGLRHFNIGILQERAAVMDFQLAAQKTIGDLYEMTSTAGNEVDPEKVKILQKQTLQGLQQLDTDHTTLKHLLADSRVTPETIKSFDAQIESYKSGAADVVEMVTIEPSTAMSWMTQTRGKFTKLDALLDQMRQTLTAEKEDRLAALTFSMTKGRYIFAAIILAASMIVLFLAFAVRRFITAIDTLNASMTAMLDSLGQGLLFFDATGICSPVHSKACLTLLETNPSNKPVVEVLKLPPDKREIFETTLAMLYGGKMPLGFSEWSDLAPTSFAHSKDMAIGLSYWPIMDHNNELKNILLVATDRSQERRVQNIIKDNELAALRTLRVFRNRNQFIRFILSFGSYITPAYIENSSIEQLQRDIHTLKGTAATFHLTDLANELHHLEDDMHDSKDAPKTILTKHSAALTKAFDKTTIFARELLGDDFQSSGEVRTVPESRLYAFARRLQSAMASGVPAPQISQLFLQEMIAVPIWNLLDDFAMTLLELADRLGKPMNPCSFSGENFAILPRIYDPLFATFVHIARNIVDHGIEPATVRQQRMKDPKASVTIRTRSFSKDFRDWFAIEFIDDGGGIDVPRLRESLATKLQGTDFDRMDDHAVIQQIFSAKVSTKDTATMYSGRGVGLNAVKIEVEKLGGAATLFSKRDQGVTLRIELPLLHDTTLHKN